MAVTLAAAMLALFPAVAGAQTEDKSNYSSVVVRPGDSLWSISEEQLGPNATPQRIVEGAEQIYALNRERIGADPDLILVGQQLLVPRAMQSERLTGATPAHKKTAEAGPRDRAAKSTTSNAPRTTPSRADAKGGEASETVAQREPESVIFPDAATAAPVPDVRAVASNHAQPLSSVASFLGTIRTEVLSATSALVESFRAGIGGDPEKGRRLLGLGVLVLTLVVAGLMAWKLPMRRTTRGDAERWGTSSGYYGYYGQTPAASPLTPFAHHPGSLEGSLEDGDERATRQEARREAPGALGRGRRALLTGSRGISSSRVHKADTVDERGRTSKATKVKAKTGPRNGLALGAHNPKVRRAPRRVHATMRAQKLRPRRRASRRPLPPGSLGKTKGVNTRDGGR